MNKAPRTVLNRLSIPMLLIAVTYIVVSHDGLGPGTDTAGSVTTERRRFLIFKSTQTVDLQRSGLTGWLNRRALARARPSSDPTPSQGDPR